MGKETPAETTAVIINPVDLRRTEIAVEGITPLIVHRWGEKARTMMKGKHMTGMRARWRSREPEAEFEASLYRFPDGGHGLKATAFKRAMVSACRGIKGFAMAEARQAFFVRGEPAGPDTCRELVRLEGGPPVIREDMVRIQGQTADIRYRAQYPQWRARLLIEFDPRMLPLESVINLLNQAGTWVGVGERRPEKEGNVFGRFRVVNK